MTLVPEPAISTIVRHRPTTIIPGWQHVSTPAGGAAPHRVRPTTVAGGQPFLVYRLNCEIYADAVRW